MKIHKRKTLEFIFKILIFALPFCLGLAGYLKSGESVLQALYSSVCLYVLEYREVEWNIFLEIARWTAPIVTISGFLMILKNVVQRMKEFGLLLSGKAVVIYCEEEEQYILKKNIKNSIIASKDKIYAGVKDIIIMLSDDLESLDFYYRNEKRFENSNVYLRLEQIDSFLLKENRIKFFNETELIARKYWKECNLLKYLNGDTLKVKIAIIGFEQLGQKLLSFGLINNIYAPNQNIEYHVWGQNTSYENFFSDINFMNGDSVTYHGEDWEKDFDKFAECDRIIVTQEDNIEFLQMLLYLCDETEIDYYSNGEAMLENIFEGDKLRSFGTWDSILTKQNIMSRELCRLGMELNYSYSKHYSEGFDNTLAKEETMIQLWEGLDGFTRASNLAAADYHEIRLMILRLQGKSTDDFTEDEREWLSKAEHIRWSRFHFVNHWVYKPLEHARMDRKKRVHTCLVPYEALSDENKKKDWDTILRLMKYKKL